MPSELSSPLMNNRQKDMVVLHPIQAKPERESPATLGHSLDGHVYESQK